MPVVTLDSSFAMKIGFTSNKFTQVSYLWRKGKIIIISFIESHIQGMGFFTGLLRSIEEVGYTVSVPTPFPQMERILVKRGFHKKMMNDKVFGEVEVWEK